MREKLGRNRTLLIGEGSKFMDASSTGVFQPKWWGNLWLVERDGYRTPGVVDVTQLLNYDLIILTQDDMWHLFDIGMGATTPTEIFLENISHNTRILTGNFSLNTIYQSNKE